jgi:hypothetical protein
MTNHITVEELERYRDHHLSVDELIPIDKHLSQCSSCHQLFKNLTIKPERLFPLQVDLSPINYEMEDMHLLFDEQIVPYVEGTLDAVDMEITESHLEYCLSCKEELRSFINFRESLDRPVKIDDQRPRLWQRLSSILVWPTFEWSPVKAMALTVVIGATLALLLLWPTNRYKQQAQLSQKKQEEQQQPINIVPTPDLTSNEIKPINSNEVEDNLQIVLSIKDSNREIKLDKDGKLYGLDDLPANLQQNVKEALVAKEIKRPQILSTLVEESTQELSSESKATPEFKLISPLKSVIREEEPVFSWQPLRGAESYSVSVYDENYKEIARSEPITSTKWKLPTQLKRGHNYSWQVIAKRDGKEYFSPTSSVPEAKFRVLEQAKLIEIKQLEERIGKSHLTLGTLYARMGLLQEAKRELQQLLKENPNSQHIRRLLRQIESW